MNETKSYIQALLGPNSVQHATTAGKAVLASYWKADFSSP